MREIWSRSTSLAENIRLAVSCLTDNGKTSIIHLFPSVPSTLVLSDFAILHLFQLVQWYSCDASHLRLQYLLFDPSSHKEKNEEVNSKPSETLSSRCYSLNQSYPYPWLSFESVG